MKNFIKLNKNFNVLFLLFISSVLLVVSICSFCAYLVCPEMTAGDSAKAANAIVLNVTTTTAITTTNAYTTTELTTSTTEHVNVATTTTTIISTLTDTCNYVTTNGTHNIESSYESVDNKDSADDILKSNNDCVPVISTSVIDQDYVVYKPSTHYIHMSTCRWVDSTCYEILDTNDIEVRRCSECSPDMEIVIEYIPTTVNAVIDNSVSDEEFIYLCRIVYHEAGSYWISEYDKARIAAGVMNRVNDSRFPNSVLDVLTQQGQFTGFSPYIDVSGCENYQACVDAVNAYLSDPSQYGTHNSWSGNGRSNTFYYQ